MWKKPFELEELLQFFGQCVKEEDYDEDYDKDNELDFLQGAMVGNKAKCPPAELVLTRVVETLAKATKKGLKLSD